MDQPKDQARPPAERRERRPSPGPNGELAPSTGQAALVQEAVEIQRLLLDARRRTGRLISALRRERKKNRLLQSTLSTLRQIRLQEVSE